MNTLCFLTTSQPNADPNRFFTTPLPRMSQTGTITRVTTSPSLSRSSSTSTIRPISRSSTTSRPSTPKRSHSSSWYNQDDNPSLEDIARQLETLPKRLERWQSVCATNIVMALFTPTPALLFLFHPMLWILLLLLSVLWIAIRS
jgi:hypothetical protein